MFDRQLGEVAERVLPAVEPPETGRPGRPDLDAEWLLEVLAALSAAALDGPTADVDGAELIDRISVLESLKAAAGALQARLSVAFDAGQREIQADLGIPAHRRGRGVAEQIALARRESPTRGSRHLGLAKALVHEMPHTWGSFARGEVSEWRASLVVQATAVLSRDDRIAVDAELAGRVVGASDRQVAAQARAAAYHIDPLAVVNARAKEEADRRVSVRPAPEAMSILTAYLPMAQGIAAWAALDRHARAMRAAGDDRSLGQIGADTLVERLTGQASAEAVNVEVGLVMTDRALLGLDDVPARLSEIGPIPAATARELVRETLGQVWVRRLLTSPIDGAVTEVERRRRLFTGHLRRVIVHRDQYCRTPWCGAPIRHLDHVDPHSQRGATDLANGQGLCQRCNHAKQAPGWHATGESTQMATPARAPNPETVQRNAVITTTPTGHSYVSLPPPAIPGVHGAPAQSEVENGVAADNWATNDHWIADRGSNANGAPTAIMSHVAGGDGSGQAAAGRSQARLVLA